MARRDWAKIGSDGAAALQAKAKARAAQKAAPKAVPKPAKQKFAMVPEGLFPLVAKVDKPAIQLLLILLMLSGRRRAQLSEGWLALPKAVLQLIGLENRKTRSRAAGQLIAHDVLETRQPGPGMALEYRLRPTPPDITTH